jgi:membrane fusion protein, multidrug efflux system
MTIRRAYALLIPIAAIGLFIGWRTIGDPETAHAADPAPRREIPVTTATVQTRDMPVLLDGLGTVQALNVVEVKAQVTGTLIALPAKEGQEVHEGDIVAEIDPRPYKAALDQATAQRDEDIATLRSAKLDLVRFQKLAKSDFAPVQQVDDQQATVDKQTAAIALDTAMVETAQINLGYCIIKAPMNGRISLYQLNVGNLVQVASQTGIISITQDKPIAVVFTLPEVQLAQVQKAQTVGPVAVQVTDGQGKQPVATGTLLTPNNTIDTTTGTISLKAVFDNINETLWPGEFVNTRVQVDTLHDATTVPTLAIQHGPDGLFVYVVKPDRTVDQANIEVGYQDNGRTVVTKGLAAQQVVVVSGQSRLAPGALVKVQTTPPAASST